MSRPKTTAGYPQVFFEVINQVSASDKPLTLQYETKKQAQSIRFQFYDFLKTCRKSSKEYDQQIGVAGAGLVFSIDGDNLVISTRDNAKLALHMEDALRGWGGEVIGAAPVEEKEPPVLRTPYHNELPSHEQVIEKFLKD